MKKAFKAVLSSIGLSQNTQPLEVIRNDVEAVPTEKQKHQKAGKGRGGRAHKPSGIAKAKRAARKLRNKKGAK